MRLGSLPSHASQVAPCRCRRLITHSAVNRRDLLVSTSGLLLSTVELQAAAASETAEALPDADQAAVTEAAAQVSQVPGAKAAPKRRKKRPAAAAKQKAALKAPGAIPTVKLGDNLEISKVVRGCWQLDGQHRGDQLTDRTSGAAAIEDLNTFCRQGIFTLDTADNYGPSEAIIGQYMRLDPAAAHKTKILTKLSFMTQPSAADLRKQNIEYRVRSSIARLGVTTLDMIQLHWEPATAAATNSSSSSSRSVPGYVTAAKALQQLQQEGLIGQMGVANFDQRMLMDLLDAGIKPVSNQVCFSVIDRRPLLFLSRFCQSRAIPLLCCGPLAGGFLAERYLDVAANMVRIDTISKARYGTLVKQLGGWNWLQDMLRVLHNVGEKHGVPASCVASRWVLQQPGVAAIILGARNTRHIKDTQRLFSFDLDEIDMLDIDAAYEGAKQPSTDVYVWERGGNW